MAEQPDPPARGGDLLRYGRASAELESRPELHLQWASTGDRAVRRALMRSPQLPPEAAELVVATRRSGMHTLGSNPVAPVELLARNPSARRRRAAVDEVLPDGPDQLLRDPNREELVDLGSGTVDLMLARAPGLEPATAVALAARADPALDPWAAALLVARFGAPVRDALADRMGADRRRAVAALSALAEQSVRR